ncbi:MAG: mannose-6-phosphate isomerase, class I [candidate division KSB1 bacterium]|nr:mannose-6-phosphate isomerase, class I [candidate division KSB1 bacterium]
MTLPRLFKIKGKIQHYAWGGTEFIPRFLGIENRENRPFAELWFGAHPAAPSEALIDGAPQPLDRLIGKHPFLLGRRVHKRFGRLPFLLKVLDARDMLSIQVHPSKKQAEEGFVKENAAGIPLNSPQRNYKDDNHKPEMHLPLTDFWMLHGFRAEQEVRYLLESVWAWSGLREIYAGGGIEGLYRRIMTAEQSEIDAWLSPLIESLRTNPPQDRDSADYWALRAAETFPLPEGHLDRGIFSVYLLNLLHLRPGEGTFQDAGVPHAYLHGTTIELMAASDNVLRGGLTPKFVDVDELLRTVVYRTGRPQILRNERLSSVEQRFLTPTEDFQLTRLLLNAGESFRKTGNGPCIGLVYRGNVEIKGDLVVLSLQRGEAFFLADGVQAELTALTSAELFLAGVPV